MAMKKQLFPLLGSMIILLMLLSSCNTAWLSRSKTAKNPEYVAAIWLDEVFIPSLRPQHQLSQVKFDSLRLSGVHLVLHLNRNSQRYYFREDAIRRLEQQSRSFYADQGLNIDSVTIYAGNYTLYDLIPNAFRKTTPKDSSRFATATTNELKKPKPWVVKSLDKPVFASGLSGRHIALWPSHGWYYEQADDRWKWQRARLYQTVEDLLPFRFIKPYLMPMLESAGAELWLPRERGLTTQEVVIDDPDYFAFEANHAPIVLETGFGMPDSVLKGNENPFLQGTSLKVDPQYHGQNARIRIHFTAPENGHYPLYLAYPTLENASDSVRVDITHLGFKRSYAVNQQRGYATWVYLDEWHLEKDSLVVVELFAADSDQRAWGWDAFRAGGGVGVVERGGRTSGRPKFTEAGRYWLQYAGFADSLVYDFLPGKTDYTDDYVSRGEWVNALHGAPAAPNQDSSHVGRNVPIDLSLAFHTDAGFDTTSTIGTLLIYSSTSDAFKESLGDSSSRMTNRDFADILQSAIVSSIRKQWLPEWSRRGLWDNRYSEATRPNVPSVLLELLSHHNELDMRLANDPEFRFTASRAIYRGILEYLSSRDQQALVMQPLPATNLSILPSIYSDSLSVRWTATVDSLDTSAKADFFLLQAASKVEGNFKTIKISEFEQILVSKQALKEYPVLRVLAVNEGGYSLSSKKAVYHYQEQKKPKILMVDFFDRVEGPTAYRGRDLVYYEDFGLPGSYDFGITGQLLEPRYSRFWSGEGYSNDRPGFGGSASVHEQKVIEGNSGKALQKVASLIAENDFEVFSCSSTIFEQMSKEQLNMFEGVYMHAAAQKQRKKPPYFNSTDSVWITSSVIEKLQQLKELKKRLWISNTYLSQNLQQLHKDSTLFAQWLDLTAIVPLSEKAVQEASYTLHNQKLHFELNLNQDIYPSYHLDAVDFNASNLADFTRKVMCRFQQNDLPAVLKVTHEQVDWWVTTAPPELIFNEPAASALMRWMLKDSMP